MGEILGNPKSDYAFVIVDLHNVLSNLVTKFHLAGEFPSILQKPSLKLFQPNGLFLGAIPRGLQFDEFAEQFTKSLFHSLSPLESIAFPEFRTNPTSPLYIDGEHRPLPIGTDRPLDGNPEENVAFHLVREEHEDLPVVPSIVFLASVVGLDFLESFPKLDEEFWIQRIDPEAEIAGVVKQLSLHLGSFFDQDHCFVTRDHGNYLRGSIPTYNETTRDFEILSLRFSGR
ncbi:MAG: hypothetical protein WC824_06020 [Bacteroidota bacterium]